MKKIVLNIAMSIDGYIADKNHKVDWLYGNNINDDLLDIFDFNLFLDKIDNIIMGRKAYEVTKGFAHKSTIS